LALDDGIRAGFLKGWDWKTVNLNYERCIIVVQHPAHAFPGNLRDLTPDAYLILAAVVEPALTVMITDDK